MSSIRKSSGFLYETHLHTCEGSPCSISPGRDYIKRYLDLGYSGIIITDHFYRGNCEVERSLKWKQWVHNFCIGYESAKEEGARRGLDVFFGWEETIRFVDYLVYGLDKEWLLYHPEVSRWTIKKQYHEVKRYGGCVVQAHPFRASNHTFCAFLSPECIDAVEVANAGNMREDDALAMAYAKKINIPITAGSDIHYVENIRKTSTFGVYLKEKMKTISDYVDSVKNNTILGLKIPSGRCDLQGNEQLSLPVHILDRRGHKTEKELWEVLDIQNNFASSI